MTDPTYEAESPRYPEVADRDARFVGHEPKDETMTDDPKCEAGCISYYGGEKKHHKDCPYYPESLTKLNADRIEALLAERDALETESQMLKMAIATYGAEACGLLKAYHKEDGTRLATALRAALAEQEKTDDQ